MKISLILATKGRLDEIGRFVQSLTHQSDADFELIVVDQNEDDRLEPILKKSMFLFPIIHLRSEAGLSLARNIGMGLATGDVIAFPDDDCWYPPGVLTRVALEFRSQPSVDGLTGRSENGGGQHSGGSFSHRRGRVNLNNVWQRGISYTIFLRSSLCAAVGPFDEELGVGSHTRFGSGEESDYLIRAAKIGCNIQYLPDLVVYHPNSLLYDRKDQMKAFRYGMGMGRVLSKHRYKLSYSLYKIFRPIGGALLSMATFRARKAAYHLAISGGRIFGFWSSH